MQIIAVHGGAGYHSKHSEQMVKRALRSACIKGLSYLDQDEDRGIKASVTAVREAIVVLEDDGCLNAGNGSNLTLAGEVECDASIMEGSSEAFGSVGAVSGVKNPIRLANSVLESTMRPHALGRIPPMLLVGNGAASFARESGLEMVDPSELKTEESARNWRTWKERLEQSDKGTVADGVVPSSSGSASNDYATTELEVSETHLEDTVGAVACDSIDMAAGVSSGGLLLKCPGRVGEAAVFGAGCFVQSSLSSDFGVACSVSGTGEAIIRRSLAKTLCDAVSSSVDDMHQAIEYTFKEFNRRYSEDPGIVAGALILARHRVDEESYDWRLWCAFTSQSMAVGYVSDVDRKPRVVVLRQSERSTSKLFITCLPLART